MQLLYLGRYKHRFAVVIDQLKAIPPGSQILELCFGDIYIAEYCKSMALSWRGFDINGLFVRAARRKGFDAGIADLDNLASFPEADVIIMMGSLYHFHPDEGAMLEKMFRSAHTVIISEPVSNLSTAGGLIGYIAKRAANAGKGNEVYRFQTSTFMAFLEEKRHQIGYRITSVNHLGKDIIVKLEKNGKY